MQSLRRKKDKGLRCLENSDLFDECICGNNLSFLILCKKKKKTFENK